MRQTRELGKRRRSKTRIMLPLSRSSPCPLIRHAWKRGLEELTVNRVEDEGQHGRTPLFDPGSIGGLLVQYGFVRSPRWCSGWQGGRERWPHVNGVSARAARSLPRH